MKKTISLILALMVALSSFLTVTATDSTGQNALYWSENYYDFAHKAVNPSPWLGELKVGENSNVSSLLKGHYTFTAPETGYYRFSSWFEASLKIEGDKVTDIIYCGSHGEFGTLIYFEKGEGHCFRFFNNSWEEEMPDPGELTIDYFGKITSVKTEENAHVYLRDLSFNEENAERPYSVSNLDAELVFESGETIQNDSWSGKLDSAKPGRRKLTVPQLCGGPGFEIEFTLLGCNDYIEAVELGEGYLQNPGDFYSKVELSYNDYAIREEYGLFYLVNDNTPNTITVRLKDGTVINLEPKYYYFTCCYNEDWDGLTGEIQGTSWFTAGDGSEHFVSSGYRENKNGRIIFFVNIDNTETLIEEEPVCYAGNLFSDFMTFCNNVISSLKESNTWAERFEAVKSEISVFAHYCKYVFSNGYFINIGMFNELLKLFIK